MKSKGKGAVKELSKKAPLCACFNLRRAARAVTQLYDRALQPSGLRATQFTLLVSIHLAGSITITRLARRLTMDRTTLTRNLNLLEAQGLITTESGEDRRTRAVSLTDKGLEVLTRALPLWERVQAEVVEELGKRRWGDLLDLLSSAVALTGER